MKAVILERYVMHEGDLDWSGVKALIPDTTSYVRTAYEEIAPVSGMPRSSSSTNAGWMKPFWPSART